MRIVHLTASTFYGGPERQMIGLARHLPEGYETEFLSFSEGGRCRGLLSAAHHAGFKARALDNDTPRFYAATREIAEHLRRSQADVLLCHGYKADLLGRRAARRAGVPVVAVARGWTAECFRVRLYERLDRFFLRWMDRVVGVSRAQAERVRRAGVRAEKVRVIHNAVDPDRFADPDPRYRAKLIKYFPTPKARVVGAAGRLSPEKGFAVLVSAAQRVVRQDPSAGFILFGEGSGRAALLEQIKAAGLAGSFVVASFRKDLDRFIPFFDVLALPSFTEGLPNVALEACAGGVPVVATMAGGTPEVIQDGLNGLLVPPGDAEGLAARLLELIASEERMRDMGHAGRQRVVDQFSFATQADRYCDLFDELCGVAVVRACRRSHGWDADANKDTIDEPESDEEPPAEYGDPVGAAPAAVQETECPAPIPAPVDAVTVVTTGLLPAGDPCQS
jgi:glycosyltransferase involved in cell wall biosynthesis